MKLTCRYTGEKAPGEFERTDDFDIRGECPACGAGPDEMCNLPSGEELYAYIHRERTMVEETNG